MNVVGNDPFISRAQLITLFERNLATDEEIESPVIEIERVGKLIIVSSSTLPPVTSA